MYALYRQEGIQTGPHCGGIVRVARSIGTTVQTLRKFKNGAKVRADTRARLGEWARPTALHPLPEWKDGMHGSGF